MTVQGGKGVAQTVRVPSYRRGRFAKPSFELQKGYMMRRMGGGGWLKTSEYRHGGEEV